MSGGRVEAGFGAGWNEEEHQQLGLSFPDLGERFDMLEEQMAIIHGLWTEPDGWSFEGEHWQLRDSKRHGDVARGGRRHPHVLFGGRGGPRLSRLVARYGDEFNLTSASADEAPEAFARVRAACEEVGRDPDEVVYSAMTGVLVAETDADLDARVADLLVELGQSQSDGQAWLAERRQRWIIGTPDEALERVRALEATGTQRIMLQDFVPRDLDHIRLMGRIFTA